MSLKLNKLESSLDYLKLFQRFNIEVNKDNLVLKARTNYLTRPRLGYTIPKRGIRLAYRRNRLKRVIKEYFRLNSWKFPSMDYVVILKKDLSDELLLQTLTYCFTKTREPYRNQVDLNLRGKQYDSSL